MAKVAAENLTTEEAMPRLLEAVGTHLQWEIGEWWALDPEAGTMRLAETWTAPVAEPTEKSRRLQRFLQESRTFNFAVGSGLPGRVWAGGAPVWVEDVLDDEQFLRGTLARQSGLRRAFAFPVCAGEGDQVTGVMVFFSADPQPPDAALRTTMDTLHNMIGQFVRRQRTQAALQESEKRFTAFMAHTPALVAIKDSELRWMFVNERLEEAFGIQTGAVLGKRNEDWLPPEVAARVTADDRRALEEGRLIEITETVPGKDGVLIDWLTLKFPIQHVGGKPWLGIVALDITARKRAEAETACAPRKPPRRRPARRASFWPT